jgi:hypothetical protein
MWVWAKILWHCACFLLGRVRVVYIPDVVGFFCVDVLECADTAMAC